MAKGIGQRVGGHRETVRHREAGPAQVTEDGCLHPHLRHVVQADLGQRNCVPQWSPNAPCYIAAGVADDMTSPAVNLPVCVGVPVERRLRSTEGAGGQGQCRMWRIARMPGFTGTTEFIDNGPGPTAVVIPPPSTRP